jgi:hypothetical protein
MRLGAWEARLFGSRMFEYFASRDLWHMQLWHPESGVSVLTPSRLTRGRYEAFPLSGWKATADYRCLAMQVLEEHGVAMPDASEVLRLEQALVHDLVRVTFERAS